MIATFSARLTGAVDLDGIRTDLLDVVRVLEPAHASAWVAGGDR